ncbi:hypothetical protein [Marinobacterium lutimaris]|uniref:Uncharacterized protein n=1 Tax=Marinobacterium lutimaris TaxID=568106 RepID=A0A1H5XFV3_9GAMM|nr:hypothetical protein [Marinobacterium lutimaris]SEG10523.1 hypothetical protein SAMN05444390_1011371 [Marinobacterium lutimaris]
MSETAIPRDFYARDADEQALFLQETWCDNCQELNLGMSEPKEYELYGIIFIEGRCNKCGETVLTELTDDDF